MTTETHRDNIDRQETGRFDALAARWWDPDGEFRPLHDINGPRVEFIAERISLDGARVVDVGCGGGLLSEALAGRGATVTGIDAAGKALGVARLHQAGSGAGVEYLEATAEALAVERPEAYDAVCCLEMLEHVPEPASVVRACAGLAHPGGRLFFSTINRTPLAWATAIVGAEYVLRLLPRGTHRYDRLIRPSELAAACRVAGLVVEAIPGMAYNPFSRTVRIGGPPRVNYLLVARKPA